MLSEKIVNNLINTVQTGIVLINSEFEIVYSNKYFQEKTGYTHGELKGLGFFNKLIDEPAMRKVLIDTVKSCFKKPFINFEVNMKKKNNNILTAKINGSAFMEAEQLYVCFVITDITSQKAFEKVIQAGYDNLQQTTIDLDSALTKIKEQQVLLTQFKDKMTRELAIATSVQNAIIPAKFRSDSKLNIWGVSHPSEELGGDYFDFFPLDQNQTGILVADVVGHGVPAALIATMLKAYFEYYTKHYRDPDQVFFHVNNAMAAILEDTGLYLTAFYSVIDLSRMEITSTSAGHDSALCFLPDDDEPVKLTSTSNGTILGAFNNSEYFSTTSKLKAGTRLVFFTDGITEAKSSDGKFFGMENFIKYIKTCQGKSPQETIEGVLAETDKFYGSNQANDDRTMIVIDILPEWQSLKVEKDKMDAVHRLMRKKEYLSVLGFLDKLIAEDENFTEAYIMAGKASILIGEYPQSEKYLQRALSLDKNSYKALYYMGITNYHQKKYSEAKQCWLKVRELNNNYQNTTKFLDKLEKI